MGSKTVAGIDIGNSTTEVCIGTFDEKGSLTFLSGARTVTTGTKGTPENVRGIRTALELAVEKTGPYRAFPEVLLLNEAAPVIGDTAMETITETIIMESSMIGHNPSTPAGVGQAVGEIIRIDHLARAIPGKSYIVTIPGEVSYETAASQLNAAWNQIQITGAILQRDEAVLVYNRLLHKVPILDEVAKLEQIPEFRKAAIEVAPPGQMIRMLSNPYGIATLLALDADETRQVMPIAKSLIGKRSAVVIRTPGGNVREQTIPAGEIYINGEQWRSVQIDAGAEKIMEAVREAGVITDVDGQENSNVGHMLRRIKNGMHRVSGQRPEDIRITDILAVDTLAPVRIAGALAEETCMEKAVGVAAMVKTSRLPMQEIADRLGNEMGIPARVAGVEAVMASMGALTTPGTKLPLAILDMGGGSTDAALVTEDGRVSVTHQAGAGELVTMLIQTELGLHSRMTAERIKRSPLAKVESLFHIRLESGEIHFFEEPLNPRLFGCVVLLEQRRTPDGGGSDAAGKAPRADDSGGADAVDAIGKAIRAAGGGSDTAGKALGTAGAADENAVRENPIQTVLGSSEDPWEMVRIEEDLTLERIADVRREAKRKVFVTNALRALETIAPEHDLRKVPNVVLVGGSAEDFEIPEMLLEELSKYGVLCGRGNIRKTEGPRNAVATGLVMSWWGSCHGNE
ncbi:MAG: diol dehydratase reactivase subunit alpha [Lachnospiraceae bacterium]|nr:diol dehydratase reactivase subunit alpha [Lachnospiraceae bacterium]